MYWLSMYMKYRFIIISEIILLTYITQSLTC